MHATWCILQDGLTSLQPHVDFFGPEPHVMLVKKPIEVEFGFITELQVVGYCYMNCKKSQQN
jgi:hypothetical protein